MNTINVFPKGTTLTRVAISLARAGGDLMKAEAMSTERYGAFSPATAILKTAIAAGSLVPGASWDASSLSDYSTASAEFFAAVRPQSVVGRLAVRRIPLNTRVLGSDASATAYWVGSGRPKPLTKLSLAGSQLSPLKMATICVLTQELVDNAHADAEALIRAELTAEIANLLDTTFLSSAAAVANVSPAGIGNGVTPISATSDPAVDLAALVDDFPGDLGSAVFISDPATAAQLALSRDAGGSFQFPDSGPRGGSILGIPLLTSNASPVATSGGQIMLLDPTGIAYGDEGVLFDEATAGTLEMLDNPTNRADSVTATTQVSLFQSDAVALKAVLFANWARGRPSVSVLTGASY